MLLATVALAAVAGPIAMGLMNPYVVKADEAQNPQLANLHFTSASLKPVESAEQTRFVMQPNGEFANDNITIKNLIAIAYGVKPECIVGGPDWIGAQRFNFEAHWTPTAETGGTMPAPPPGAPRQEIHVSIASAAMGGPSDSPGPAQVRLPAAVQAMLRNFLAERVDLKLRNDSRILPVYELVVANGGSRLTPTADHQESPGAGPREIATRVEARYHDGNLSYSMTNAEPNLLCENLSGLVGHEVIDKTGLTGRYDFQITYPADADPNQLAAILRDQYGLDLQSSQQPVKVLAVDNVQMPQN
jgi:uncharacterized protein (TIGR03435 family)